MVRDYLFSLRGGAFMLATWTGFGACIAPEPAELTLGRLWADAAQTMPIRTLPPEVPALRCVMVWIGTAGCPAAPPLPEKPEHPAVPTS
jgi:hypothetical protein